MYVGNSYTAFAFLRREHHEDIVYEDCCTGSATISGVVGKDDIQVVIKPTTVLHLDPEQEAKVTELLLQNAIWSKLVDLEHQALHTSGKSACAVQEEPLSKRLCLNGSSGHFSSDADISVFHKQLLDISLQSHILSPLTYLRSENFSRTILQMLPYESHTTRAISHSAEAYARHKARHHRRKYYHHHHHFIPSRHASFSFATVARSTISSVSSHLKSVIGLFLPDTNLVPANDVQMLEDEVEYQEKKGSQLQLDSTFNLIYPPCYYSSQGAPFSSTNKKATHQMDLRTVTGDGKPIPLHKTSDTRVISKHFSDEINISDTESDSSLDPDWEGLKQPNNLLPLIYMQLFSGAWPLVRPFSYAVGVPLSEIRKLPLIVDKQIVSPHPPCSTEDIKEEKANFWCTVLAISCLEEHFAHLFTEWELVAYKGKIWLEQNQHQCDLTLNEAYQIARRLVLKQS